MAVTMVLRTTVARSASSERKLRTVAASSSVASGRLVRTTYSPAIAASAAISAPLRANRKLVSVMARSKCFFILWRLSTSPTASAMAAAQRGALAFDPLVDPGQIVFGGEQQLFTLTPAFSEGRDCDRPPAARPDTRVR